MPVCVSIPLATDLRSLCWHREPFKCSRQAQGLTVLVGDISAKAMSQSLFDVVVPCQANGGEGANASRASKDRDKWVQDAIAANMKCHVCLKELGCCSFDDVVCFLGKNQPAHRPCFNGTRALDLVLAKVANGVEDDLVFCFVYQYRG